MQATYKRHEGRGNYHETPASIKRRISEAWGFKPSAITLLETSLMMSHKRDGIPCMKCNWVAFRVCGLGYQTDFGALRMAPAYNN